MTSELALLLLQIGFLVLLWFFVGAVVYSLRADLFGVKVRKLAEPAVAAAAPAAAPATPAAATAPVAPAKPSAAPSGPRKATRDAVSRIIITSGPKAGLELPLTGEPLTIGRSSESGLVIRDDYTSSHHARLLLWGDQWMLQDLDSTNGTWHDGERVASPVPVLVGAPIKVGATTFELRK
ncbi:MAG: FHA domain-containing protein [Microbacterium sp. SCN 70-27]|uniref:FHA domain-containing protein FhaB/FipA n=1 Tax=unclassified Microbacterium TaxID=2609290 RepID=UPI00086F1B50|nr:MULTISPECIES: FHA domain-containing protein [unclassified Microbacterium]MBN9224865.1 FHA domain-containing protein [Microbacterium sp.]ODT26444.1 MAG: FHA domain-containing protein [Microbacterium sp. SCN 70-27]